MPRRTLEPGGGRTAGTEEGEPYAKQEAEPDVGVLLADHDPVVRRVLAHTLRGAAGVRIDGAVGTFAELLDHIRREVPPILLLDPRMPDFATAPLRAAARDSPGRRLRVLVFTRTGPGWSTTAAVRDGAAGFLRKEDGLEQVPPAVLAVAGGHAVLPPSELRRLVAHRHDVAGTLREHERFQTLTRAETKVLRLVALGLSSMEVAERLGISPGTVKSHVSHILVKLKVRDRVQAVALTYRAGLAPLLQEADL